MSDKRIIPFDGKKVEDIDTGGGGVFCFFSFNRLRLLLGKDCGISDKVTVTGLMIKADGIEIKIELKP